MPLCSHSDPDPYAQFRTRRFLTFQEIGDFCAYRAAERFLEARGFSVGRMEAHSPTGILFGRFNIQKWRNLRPGDREELHGHLTAASFRDGPVRVVLFDTAPAEAIAAFGVETADA